MKQKQGIQGSEKEHVTLNLTVQGNRDQLMTLLKQMNHMSGFAVLKGSFISKKQGQ